uniref:Large ribosomal subunit protein bL32c n=1 Tax=Pulsatilla cernua var. koreana TaxID=387930 RepID=A0A7L8Y950_9MAGN|nr:plastid ribosomal protein L32 [Pulsatilla cernua var. koreana]
MLANANPMIQRPSATLTGRPLPGGHRRPFSSSCQCTLAPFTSRSVAVCTTPNVTGATLVLPNPLKQLGTILNEAVDSIGQARAALEAWLLGEKDPFEGLIFMAVPKKRTSRTKKTIRKNIWKNKAAVAAKKAYALGKSLSTGNSKSFFVKKTEK